MPFLIPSITPELKLASVLSRPKLSGEQVDIARSLLRTTDQVRLQKLFKHHSIWPCVYCNIKDYFPELLTKPGFNFLRTKYQQNVRQSQRTFETCGKLLRRFKELDVDVKVVKGMPLAFKLYGDISKRHSRDLDLIILNTELNQAHLILVSFGFQCAEFEALTNEQKSIYFEAQKDLTYHDGAGTVVELHLRLTAFSMTLADHYVASLFNHVSLEANQTVELIYLCWHGSHTLFHRLKWLVDIALYIEQEFTEDSEQLIDLAGRLDASRILTVSWLLASILFDTKVPEKISDFYQQDMATRIIISKCLKQLNNPKTAISLRFKLERLLCEPLLYQKRSEKIAALSYQFKPTILDFKTVTAIPPHLSFLYYPLRPFLFLYRRLLNK